MSKWLSLHFLQDLSIAEGKVLHMVSLSSLFKAVKIPIKVPAYSLKP